MRGLALLGASSGEHLGHVRSEASVAGHDRVVVLGVEAELPLLAHRLGQQLPSKINSQLVRRKIIGDVGAATFPVLDVGAVSPNPYDDPGTFGVGLEITEREGGQLAGVDLTELGDESLQSFAIIHPVAVGGAEVEVGQHGEPLGLTGGDLVEHVLHLGGERVVHQLGEVLFQQPGDREGQPGRDQRGSLLEHVVPAGDRADDRRVRRRPADLQLLQLRHQRGLGVAGRRASLVTRGRDLLGPQLLSFGELRDAPLAVVVGGALVGGLHVRLHEAGEGDGRCRWR